MKGFHMKKIADVFYYIALFIFMVSSIFCFIYEYLIWDKSTIPDYFFNLFLVPGLICLSYVGIYYYCIHKK